MMLTSGAEPCAKCGTTGGFIRAGCRRACRSRGLCNCCYVAARRSGTLTDHPHLVWGQTASINPHRWPHLNDVAAIGAMLWTATNGQRQQHAVYGHPFDARAEVAEAEHDAARWLMTHNAAPLLDWPDARLALFGAATPLTVEAA